MASKFQSDQRVVRHTRTPRGNKVQVSSKVIGIRKVGESWLRDRGITDYSETYLYTLEDLSGPFEGTVSEVLEPWLQEGSVD